MNDIRREDYLSKLKFPNLKSLVLDMEKNKVEKEHFSFNYAKQKIDCVFLYLQRAL